MCTLTLITQSGGYLMGMNRDENRLREKALPPVVQQLAEVEAAYPREGATGGTWIASNARGVTLALLNQYPADLTAPRLRSRGHVIPQLIHTRDTTSILRQVGTLDLSGMLPFLLVGVFPDEWKVAEWKWDGLTLQDRSWEWEPRHWFSSSVSDTRATQIRGAFCAAAWRDPEAGSLEWLRRLHVSHAPEMGPFSICVHRDDAASISYTEAVFDGRRLDMRYHSGQPCHDLERFDGEVVLHNPQWLPGAG